MEYLIKPKAENSFTHFIVRHTILSIFYRIFALNRPSSENWKAQTQKLRYIMTYLFNEFEGFFMGLDILLCFWWTWATHLKNIVLISALHLIYEENGSFSRFTARLKQLRGPPSAEQFCHQRQRFSYSNAIISLTRWLPDCLVHIHIIFLGMSKD